MISFPNCKINLGLNILFKRDDGFHELETCFYPVFWNDALEIIKSNNSGINLHINGLPIETGQDINLIEKAYSLLSAKYKLSGYSAYLQKNIPMGAGLGGGSSDAAHTLLLINKLENLNIEIEQLKQMASELGADCSFFIENRPMLGTGIGNILRPISVSLNDFCILIIKPDVFVSTKEAYQFCIPSQPKEPLESILKKPITYWKDNLVNDFEKSVFKIHPQLEKIKQELYLKGAIYASLSGSGSALFAIFVKNQTTKPFEHLGRVFVQTISSKT